MAFFNSDLQLEQFLQDYWQQRPLVIRQAYQQLPSFDWHSLQHLATNDTVESRLIVGAGRDWQLSHGPFVTDDFEQLPAQDWTLLVQDVDKFNSALAAMLADFGFVPDWRLDDIMVSYAAPGGSVGPHTDSYDVFLLQASGHRRWQISSSALNQPVWMTDCDLRILDNFQPDETFVLGPGDMLYLPPHYAHHGVAEDFCMTYSIGFRAPSGQELLDAVLIKLLETEQGIQRFRDPLISMPANKAEIPSAAIDRFKSLLNDTLKSAEPLLQEVIGELITAVKPSLEEVIDSRLPEHMVSQSDLQEHFNNDGYLIRNRLLRIAWAASGEQVQVFYAGQSEKLSAEWQSMVKLMCEQEKLSYFDWIEINQSENTAVLLETLVNEGVWQML